MDLMLQVDLPACAARCRELLLRLFVMCNLRIPVALIADLTTIAQIHRTLERMLRFLTMVADKAMIDENIFLFHVLPCFERDSTQVSIQAQSAARAQRLTSDYRPAGPTASSLPFVRPKNGNAHRLFPCPRAGRGSINRDDPERDIITYSGLPAPRRPTSQAGPLPFKPAGGIAGGRDIFPRSGVGEQVGYFLYTT